VNIGADLGAADGLSDGLVPLLSHRQVIQVDDSGLIRICNGPVFT